MTTREDAVSFPPRRRTHRSPFATALFLLAIWPSLLLGLVGCSESDTDLILQPPVNDDDSIETGEASISGILTFDGKLGGVGATVHAVRSYDPSCETSISSIHITGEMNDWDESLWGTTPGLRSLGGCIWFVQIDLSAGPVSFKLVTDRAWNTPADFVGTGSLQGLSGDAPRTEQGPDLQVDIPLSASYFFYLNESNSPAQYFILTEAEAPQTTIDVVTGEFTIDNLGAGLYTLIIVADGFQDFRISDVTVADAPVDVGTQDLSSRSGEIQGSVLFADVPDPLPTATVDLIGSAGTIAATTQTDESGFYVFTGIDDDTYSLAITAAAYLSAEVDGIVFANGDFVTVDPVTLSSGCESAYEIVEVLGEFNAWTPLGQMTAVEACVWEDTLTIVTPEGGARFFMKFRTGGDWGVSPDFVHCGTEADTLGLSGDLCLGDGNAAALPITFPETGDYLFRVDESQLTFGITLLGSVELGSATGIVAFEGNPDPTPVATIEILNPGTTEVVATASSGSDGGYLVENIPVGTYDVSIAAFGFVDQILTSQLVRADETTDLGTTTLVVSESCESISEIVQILGDFNNWSESTEPMTQLGKCLFADTLQVAVTSGGGTHFMKLRTGNSWGNPPDYGSCATEADTLSSGDSVCPANDGPAIRFFFAETGEYEFILNEETRTLEIRLLGTITLGTVTGDIEFSDGPDPLPAATIELRDAGGAVAAQALSGADGSFSIENVNEGTYDLVADAFGYDAVTLASVSVAKGESVAVGTLTLVRQKVCAPLSEIVQILGDFNAWNENTAPMTQQDNCLFADTVAISVAPGGGTHFMKFRTGNAWGTPADYGTCGSEADTLFGGGSICPANDGPALLVYFENSGDYEVTLNEEDQTFSFVALTQVLPGAIEGTVGWSDTPQTPPATTIRAFADGTNRVDGETTADAAGAYLIEDLEAGVYDLEASAPGYETARLEDVTVEVEATTTAAAITLTKLADCTPSSAVEIVGNFNSYPPEGQAPHMTDLGNCAWIDTLSITASELADSTISFNFRLNDRLEDARGSCDSETLLLEEGGAVTASFCDWRFVNWITVRLPGDGDYIFRFDEGAESFSLETMP